jgi:hypothetical protein
MLVVTRARATLHLVVIPVLRSATAAAVAWQLAIPENLLLLVFGAGGVAMILHRKRRSSG